MRIFISYSSRTREMTQLLIDYLEGSGYSVWYDQELVGGQHWWDRILENIRISNGFIIALTPEWLDSEACRIEFNYARQIGKFILPVRLDSLDADSLPHEIAQIQFVSFVNQDLKTIAALNRSLSQMPSIVELPHPLPEPPPLPLSPLGMIKEKMQSEILEANEQITIVAELEKLLKTDKTALEARKLLEDLLQKSYLLYSIGLMIEELVGRKATTQTPKSAKMHNTKFPRLEPHVFTTAYRIRHVAFSANYRHLLTGSYPYNIHDLWDITSGENIRHFERAAAAISSDSQLALFPTKYGEMVIENVLTGESIHSLKYGNYNGWRVDSDIALSSASFSPDSELLLTGHSNGMACLWSTSTGKEIRRFFVTNHVSSYVTNAGNRSVSFSAISKVRFIAEHAALRIDDKLFDVDSMQQLSLHHLEFLFPSNRKLSTDNRFVIEWREEDISYKKVEYVILYDAQTKTQLHKNNNFSVKVREMIHLGGDKYTYLGIDKSDPTMVRAIDYAIGTELRRYEGHTDEVNSILISPDKKYMLTGSEDGTVRLWETKLV